MFAGNDTKQFLTSAIRRALSGEHIAESDIEEHAGNWRGHSQLQKSALIQLQNWFQDRPLRAQYGEHARYSERRLAKLLYSLEDQDSL